MGILLCEIFFRNVWIRNESVRAEIGQILHTDTHPHTHTTAAKLVVRISDILLSSVFSACLSLRLVYIIIYFYFYIIDHCSRVSCMFLYCDILLYMYSMLNEFIVIFMTDQCNIRPVASFWEGKLMSLSIAMFSVVTENYMRRASFERLSTITYLRQSLLFQLYKVLICKKKKKKHTPVYSPLDMSVILFHYLWPMSGLSIHLSSWYNSTTDISVFALRSVISYIFLTNECAT